MAQIVLDASVAVKLFKKEEYTELALKIYNSYLDESLDILVPSLFYYEVLNSLRFSMTFSEKELEEAIKTIDKLNLSKFDLNGAVAQKAMRLSLKFKISIYDAAYVALAEIMNTILYTADDKLIIKTKLPFIKHLREFEGRKYPERQ